MFTFEISINVTEKKLRAIPSKLHKIYIIFYDILLIVFLIKVKEKMVILKPLKKWNAVSKIWKK